MKLLVKPKKKCCKDSPRCKRCPVVCKRLVKRGLADRRSDGIVVIRPGVSKKQIKTTRVR